jgi:CheY-like chemotaxis protein
MVPLAPPSAAPTKPLVLVIDDSPDMRETVGMIIESKGYRVVLAHHGQHALDQIRDGGLRPDAIILDLTMPVMDGLTFLAEKEHEPLLDDTRVIIASADRLARDGWPSSVCAVLQKPAPLFLILAALKAACFPPAPKTLANGTGTLPDMSGAKRS